MRKLLLVAREEISYHLRQWTFYLSLLMLPLLFAAAGALPRLQDVAQDVPLPEIETVLNINSDDVDELIGYVDQADIIKTVPAERRDNFRGYATEAAAERALAEGQIDTYYLIPADYLTRGHITQFSPEAQLISETDGAMRSLLRQNMLQELDDDLAARLDEPVDLLREGPPPRPFRFIPEDLSLSRLATAGLLTFFFIYVINVGGNLLLRALQREVRAHVLEIMIVNTSPEQFIGGKLLGQVALTLLQVSATLLAGLLVYGNNPDGSGPAELPLLPLLLSIPYLMLGFVAYCGVIMAVATVWPDFKESGILLGMMRLVNLLPLLGALFILPNPDGTLALLLTVFPLTAHLLMPFRLMLMPVPLWQWALGAALLLGWAVLCVWFSMRLFRLQALLTGRALSWQLVRQALRPG